MIGFLSGNVISSQNNSVILNVNGVGYLVYIIKAIKVSNKKTDLFIHTHVKEDELSLFGFSTKKELELFKNLISVSGVGPKIALSILSTGPDTDIISAIKNSSVDFFSSVPGIGKKTAQKLIIDLKSKLDNSSADLAMLNQDSVLLEGLMGLGFAKKEIQKIAPKIRQDLEIKDQIKMALRLLNK